MTLGKTAGGLFWMFRYLERAENTARLLEAGWHIALTRASAASSEWESIITTTGMKDHYEKKFDTYDAATVINFMLRDRDNPSSVLNSSEAARNNARLVRTALSSAVWEAVNESWLALKSKLARPVTPRTLHETLTLIRTHTSMVRGALHGTMLRNDIYAFARLGTFIERGDNTARILDVKYYVLLPSAASIGSVLDNAQWDVILRSVSALRAYRWLHAGDVTSKGIADFLILDQRMPRSLSFCNSMLAQNLQLLEQAYGQRSKSQDMTDDICARMATMTIDSVLDFGLHEFLLDFLARNADLAQQLETDFRFYR